jgi:hypothetical protein
MLSREDEVEIVALHRRGWSVSAIARHTGRDRKTIRAWLAEGEERRRAPSVLEPFRDFIERRFADDPHLDATVLVRELRRLGFDRSYQTLTRELRRLGLRPECRVCMRGGHRLTIELAREPGEELQLDWLELAETPWGAPAYVLVGTLSHSGRIRAVLSDGDGLRAPRLGARRGAAPARRHRPLLAHRPDGDGGRAGHGSAALGGSRAREALRGHGRRLPTAAGATASR